MGEHAAVVLGSLHNTTFLVEWVRSLRASILDGTFETTAPAMRARYVAGEERWAALHAADPDGRHASRQAAAGREARRRERFDPDDPA